MRPARSPKAGARSGDAAAASHFRRKRPFACGGPSRARCARARPRASGGGWAPKPRPPGDGREPWRSPALTRQSRVRAHARPDGANAESRPGSAPSRSRNRSRSLSSGQRDSRRPVRQRAGKSGSQVAPHAELVTTAAPGGRCSFWRRGRIRTAALRSGAAGTDARLPLPPELVETANLGPVGEQRGRCRFGVSVAGCAEMAWWRRRPTRGSRDQTRPAAAPVRRRRCPWRRRRTETAPRRTGR